MKNFRYFLYGICLVLLLLIILFIFGFKFTYAPDLDNNWEAISAASEILGVIISSFLTGLIIFQTNKIDKSSKEQARLLADKQYDFESHTAEKEMQTRKLELKISLYDKRYAIYERIYPYTDRVKSAIQASKNPMPDGTHFNSKDLVIESLIDSTTRTHTKERIEQLNNDIKRAGTKEKVQKLTNDKNKLLAELEMEKFKFLSNDETIIMLAEFCYPKEIAIPIIEYFKIILNWYLPGTSVTEEDVLSSLEDLHNKKILESMKSLLTLSYENQ